MSIASIASALAGKIGELVVQEGKFLYGVKDQVQSLQRELVRMKAFLIDIDGAHNHTEGDDEGEGDAQRRGTITEIRNIAYEAEDVIDSYIQQLEGNNAGIFPQMCVCLCRSIPHTHQVGCEIESIKTRLSEVEGWRNYQSQNQIYVAEAEARRSRRPRIVYPETNDEHVVGLDADINKLVGELTTDGFEPSVLLIVGMGGSGKTTLARKLHNHDRVIKHFNCIAWISVSRNWDADKIFGEILRKASVSIESGAKQLQEEVVEKLRKYLKDKTYLIVLDDVWEKEALDYILQPLPIQGRRVIITSRKREVVDLPFLKCSIHEPMPLTEEESWELFTKLAPHHKGVDVFEKLGKEMLKTCEGLPLAVIALAGILDKKKSIEDWERVNKSVSSKIVSIGRGINAYGSVKRMLGLSYDALAYDLKPCFLYLSRYPPDYEIPTQHLIRLWIAEGFITCEMLEEGETLEDVAAHKLDDLVQSNVVQIGRINDEGRLRSIRVHGLFRDVSIEKAKKQDFLEVLLFDSRSLQTVAGAADLRRTAILPMDKTMCLPLPTKSSHLRSLEYIAPPSMDMPHCQMLRVHDICKNFRLLRVLILAFISTQERSLPSDIGSLVHLRYLALRETKITSLPSTIGNLHNLQTLDFRSSLSLFEEFKIPNVFWKMENLRHVNLGGVKIKGKVKLHTLKQLQTLKGIKGDSWMLEELPRLSPTVQKLDITGIATKNEAEAAFRCPSIVSDNLRSLSLSWGLSNPSDNKLLNLQPINHCQHLRKLSLDGSFEDRLGSLNQIPISIVKLKLGGTEIEGEAGLAILGKLPNLIVLNLEFVSYMGTKWSWIAGQFSQLRELSIQFLPEWKEWIIEEGAMPKLTTLSIQNCGKLRRLPEGLKFITTLQEVFIVEKGDELKNRIKGGGGEDAHIIQHVPRVEIHDVDSDPRRGIHLRYMEFLLSKRR